MAVTRVTHPEVPEPPLGTWSNCLVVGNQIFVAGMTARNDAEILADDEYGQAQAIFSKIAKLMDAAGASMSDVVKVVIYVTDISQREEVWRARREFFQGDFLSIDAGRGERSCHAGTQGRGRSGRCALRLGAGTPPHPGAHRRKDSEQAARRTEIRLRPDHGS